MLDECSYFEIYVCIALLLILCNEMIYFKLSCTSEMPFE